jgi:uncharacterized protein YceH (UPF0502 family)
MIELSPVQQRVVGALAEKELATPDNYPLSMNALMAACNQTTNREPVLTLTEETVDNALANLRSLGIVRVVYSKGMRVDKYRHVLHEVLDLQEADLAVLTVMLLRGPQTVAELRTRTERLHRFDDTAALDATLSALASRDEPLVVLQPRQPGQKEPRWAHLLGPNLRAERAPVSREVHASSADVDPYAALEARIAALEARLDEAGI